MYARNYKALKMNFPTEEEKLALSWAGQAFWWVAGLLTTFLGAFLTMIGIAERRANRRIVEAHERIGRMEASLSLKASIASVEAVAADVKKLMHEQALVIGSVAAVDVKVQRVIDERKDDVITFRQIAKDQRDDNQRTADAISGMSKSVSEYSQRLTEMMADRPTRGEVRGMKDRRLQPRED